MRIGSNVKAVSSFIMIILMICSMVIGAFISYFWVMAAFYNMPENKTFIVVENATFPMRDADRFNVTVLNPSNSALDVNITGVRINVEGTYRIYEFNLTAPFLLRKAARETLNFTRNWSEFAAETVRIEPIITGNASVTSLRFFMPMTKLSVQSSFDPSRSVSYFEVTVQNSLAGLINLTISEIKLYGEPITANVTPSLPFVMAPGQIQNFRCNRNWESLRGQYVNITVRASEGHEAKSMTGKLLGAVLSVEDARFSDKNTNSLNVTVRSSADSTTKASISGMNVTLQNGTKVKLISGSFALPSTSTIEQNKSTTFLCVWNWTNYRNQTFSVEAFSREGFSVLSKTGLRSPPALLWSAGNATFDLDDLNHFSINVTSRRTSLYNLTFTRALFNQTDASFASQPVRAGTEGTLLFTFNWTGLQGKNLNLTLIAQDGSKMSKIINIPAVGLKIVSNQIFWGELNSTPPIGYFSFAIANSNNSIRNATITRVVLEVNNVAFEIDGNQTIPSFYPRGYLIKIGETTTLICPWNWLRYLQGSTAKITVYTTEGFKTSRTWALSHP